MNFPVSPSVLPSPAAEPIRDRPRSYTYQPSVTLRQSPIWSRAILWGLVASAAFAFTWAHVAQIEEAVATTGKLAPQGTVKEVQSPMNGVVKEVLVKDGQQVKKGDLLLKVDPTGAQAQLKSLETVRKRLVQENQVYRSYLGSAGSVVNGLEKITPELASLAKSRAALASEIRMYQAQLNDLILGSSATLDEQQYLQYSRAEVATRTATLELETQQLGKQFNQAQIQLASAKDMLAVNQRILNDIEPLVKEGAIARIQYLKQDQEVRKNQAEVAQLAQEQQRIRLAISQGQEKLENTIALGKKEILIRMAENNKRIAEIDSQFNKLILENEKRIAETENQISQAKLTLKYQELRAPANGTVFDLLARSPGFVLTGSQPVMKIVPDEALVAEVFITNKDIGFIKPGMEVDVRIDSFPFSEFGDVKGEITSIGSDALPPTQIRPFYSFPSKVKLKHLSLSTTKDLVRTPKGQEIRLQSGMSISANIKIRKRSVMSIITDTFSQKMESLKSVR
jgi:hemolysin D